MQQGGARAARGEFIVLQIEAARASGASATELRERADTIPKEWLPPLPGGFEWSRGFPSRWISIDPETFVAHADRVLAAAPTVLAAELYSPRPSAVGSFFACPALARLREL